MSYQGELYIFNHIAMERIFDVRTQFYAMANEALNKLKELDKIDNIEEFIDDCLSDKRIQRMLSKMWQEADKWDHAFDNLDAIKETINLFELDITITNDNRVAYRDKSQLRDILYIIRDSYYISSIQKRKGIDDA
jgi:hypothetical protein